MCCRPCIEKGSRINDDNLPNPYPPRRHPPFIDLSFASLGWIVRTADAVGSDRFTESVSRSRFYLGRTDAHAKTPAQKVVLAALVAALDGLAQSDADAREVLSDSVSEMMPDNIAELEELMQSPEEG